MNELCEACRSELNDKLTMKDIIKGTRNFNYLLDKFNAICCEDCRAIIMQEGVKWAHNNPDKIKKARGGR